MARYNAKESERFWQQEWDARSLFATPAHSDKPKAYVLEMFPYRRGASIWAMRATTPWAM